MTVENPIDAIRIRGTRPPEDSDTANALGADPSSAFRTDSSRADGSGAVGGDERRAVALTEGVPADRDDESALGHRTGGRSDRAASRGSAGTSRRGAPGDEDGERSTGDRRGRGDAARRRSARRTAAQRSGGEDTAEKPRRGTRRRGEDSSENPERAARQRGEGSFENLGRVARRHGGSSSEDSGLAARRRGEASYEDPERAARQLGDDSFENAGQAVRRRGDDSFEDAGQAVRRRGDDSFEDAGQAVRRRGDDSFEDSGRVARQRGEGSSENSGRLARRRGEDSGRRVTGKSGRRRTGSGGQHGASLPASDGLADGGLGDDSGIGSGVTETVPDKVRRGRTDREEAGRPRRGRGERDESGRDRPGRSARVLDAERPGRTGGRRRTAAAERAYARRAQRDGYRSEARTKTVPEEAAVGRASLVVLVIALLAVGVAATLWLTTQAVADSYTLERAKKEVERLANEAAALQREVTRNESASALAERARQLGMVPAGDPARIVVQPDGSIQVVGEATPVAPPPTPDPNNGTQPPVDPATQPPADGTAGQNGQQPTGGETPTTGQPDGQTPAGGVPAGGQAADGTQPPAAGPDGAQPPPAGGTG